MTHALAGMCPHAHLHTAPPCTHANMHTLHQHHTPPHAHCVVQDPVELELVNMWEGSYRALLVNPDRDEEVEEQFITKAGKPFDQSSLCDWWKNKHKQSGAVWPFITMHNIRHIMVEAVMSSPGQVDPAAGAMLMGNSTKQWDSSYDRGKGGRMVVQGLADVAKFRAATLGDVASRGPSSPAAGPSSMLPAKAAKRQAPEPAADTPTSRHAKRQATLAAACPHSSTKARHALGKVTWPAAAHPTSMQAHRHAMQPAATPPTSHGLGLDYESEFDE